MKTLRRLTVNFSGRVRRVVKDGREYLVAPVTMIVPGVLPGSKGPLYYPPEEIRKNYDSWNGVPLVVGHPKVNGVHVSARHPDVVETHGIGTVYSASVHNGKLKAEGWFDVKKTAKVDRRILDSLNAGRRIELSTGLFTDNIPAPYGATHNGRGYDYVARNYRPDHLAILPDEVGACSTHDGCGVLVNKRSNTHSCKCKGACDSCKGKRKMPLTANQREALVSGLIESGDVWTEDDEATLNALEDTQLLGLRKQSLALNCMGMEGKKKLVQNAEEDDEEVVMEEEEDDEVVAKKEVTEPVEEEKAYMSPTGNKKLTAAEFYDMAPPEVKEALREAVAVRNEKKGQLIRQLTANVKDEKKRELVVNKLKDKSLDDLRELVELIPTTNTVSRGDNPFAAEPNYMGAAGYSAPMTLNADERDDILPLPTMDWSQKTA